MGAKSELQQFLSRRTRKTGNSSQWRTRAEQSEVRKSVMDPYLGMLAVVYYGLKHFRVYIYGQHVTFITDHQALVAMLWKNEELVSDRQMRWKTFILGHEIDMVYRKGSQRLTWSIGRGPTPLGGVLGFIYGAEKRVCFIFFFFLFRSSGGTSKLHNEIRQVVAVQYSKIDHGFHDFHIIALLFQSQTRVSGVFFGRRIRRRHSKLGNDS